MDVSVGLQLKRVLLLSAGLVLLLAVTAKSHAREDLAPHQQYNTSQYTKADKYAHHWRRGYRYYGGYRYYYGPRWRSYRYYWRTMSYRCYGARCYKRMCLYRRGVWHPVRCKTRRWWRY